MLEAWGHRDPGERFTSGRWDPPHLICWAEGTRTGKALCGKELEPLKLELPGTAAGLKVTVCAACRRKAAPPPTLGKVVDLAGRRSPRPVKRRPL